MAESTNQSFIPRNTPRKKEKRTSVRRVYVFAYLSYTIFIATIIAAGGVFLYKYSVESSLVSEQERLIVAQDQFNESDIEFIRSYEERLRTAEFRLQNQMMVSRFLSALQRVAVANAYFDNLTYERVSTAPATIDLTVLAPNFETLLYQREQFRTNAVTDAADMAGVALAQQTDQETGANQEEVSLDITLTLSPDDLRESSGNNQVNTIERGSTRGSANNGTSTNEE